MKKKIFVGILIIVLIVLLIPKKREYWDGGTVEYKSIIYKVTKYRSLNEDGKFDKGLEIKIFGFKIYDNYNKLN